MFKVVLYQRILGGVVCLGCRDVLSGPYSPHEATQSGLGINLSSQGMGRNHSLFIKIGLAIP